jgi:hypothetical protein
VATQPKAYGFGLEYIRAYGQGYAVGGSSSGHPCDAMEEQVKAYIERVQVLHAVQPVVGLHVRLAQELIDRAREQGMCCSTDSWRARRRWARAG